MKLAFCLFKYFPFGGLQRDFLRIAQECVRRGHQVEIFTMAWEGESDPALTIHIIPVTGHQNHTRARQFTQKIKPYLGDYDVVIGFNKMPYLDIYYAADTCYQAKAKSKRGLFYQLIYPFTPRYRYFVAYEKAVFSADKNTHILLLSPAQQEEFIKFYHTPATRFELLPPGIARDRIAPVNANPIRQEVREKFNIKPEQFLLLLVGSGFKTKGLDRVLLACAALPSALKQKIALYIVGKDHSHSFQKQAKKLKIDKQIKFLGGRSDIPDLLLAGDLLLHPAYNENTGTILLEALVAGLPVITTDVCGYAHYINDANIGKVLASPFQQTIFNQTLTEVLLSSDQRASWRENGLAFAKHTDIYSLPERAADAIERIAVANIGA